MSSEKQRWQRRLVAAAAAAVFLMGIWTTASVTAAEETGDYEYAQSLVDFLAGTPFMDGAPEAAVSRGDFTAGMARLLKVQAADGAAVFQDVPSSDDRAVYIYGALAQGWISRGEAFLPDQAITVQDAAKIAVCAMGYQAVAQARGGYPAGYTAVARSLDLIEGSGELTGGQFYLLLSRMLLTEEMREAELWQSSENRNTRYQKDEKTLLERLYGFSLHSGTITATHYGSLYHTENQTESDLLELDGIPYRFTGEADGLLGRHCDLLLDEGETVMLVLLCDNAEQVIDSRDFLRLEGQSVAYAGADGRPQRAVFDADAPIIYNGRYCPGTVDFQAVEGSFLLLDNDRDQRADVILIEDYTYFRVESIDQELTRIGAADRADSIDLDGFEGLVLAFEQSGEALELYQLQRGDILAVQKSKDGLLLRLTRLNQTVSGVLDAFWGEEGELELAGGRYWVSPSCMKRDQTKLIPGRSCTIWLGMRGEVAAVDSDGAAGAYQYGYLISYSLETGLSDTLWLKVFSQSGQIEVLTVASRITMDGGALSNAPQQLHARLEQGFAPQLVRYRTRDGQLKGIDFAEAGLEYGVDRDEENRLTQYQLPASEFLYKSAYKGCPPYFSMSKAVVFQIPFKADDEANYRAVSYAAFQNNDEFNAQVYDIDEYLYAGAMVIQETTENAVVKTDETYLVEETARGIDEDGNAGSILSCWGGGRYHTFFLDDGIEAAKESGQPLGPGDLVRVSLDAAGKVRAIGVDFDFSSGMITKDYSGGATFEGGNVSFSYSSGQVYSCDGSYAAISTQRLEDGGYDFSPGSLRSCILSTTKQIVQFDCKTGAVMPLEAANIASYLSDGTKADILVIRQSSYSAKTVFVYHQ